MIISDDMRNQMESDIFTGGLKTEKTSNCF